MWTSAWDFPSLRAAAACRRVSFVLVSISRSSAPVNFFTLDFAAASTGSAPRSNVRFRTLPCVAFGSSDSARSSSRSPSTFSDIRVIRGGGGLLRRGRLDCHLFRGGRPFCGLGARRGERLALVEHNQLRRHQGDFVTGWHVIGVVERLFGPVPIDIAMGAGDANFDHGAMLPSLMPTAAIWKIGRAHV